MFVNNIVVFFKKKMKDSYCLYMRRGEKRFIYGLKVVPINCDYKILSHLT